VKVGKAVQLLLYQRNSGRRSMNKVICNKKFLVYLIHIPIRNLIRGMFKIHLDK